MIKYKFKIRRTAKAVLLICFLTLQNASANVSAGDEKLPVNVSVFNESRVEIQKLGLPSFLSPDFNFFDIVFSFLSESGEAGTGVHIGQGYILTNRHVYHAMLGLKAKKTMFDGFEPIPIPAHKNLNLVKLPSPTVEDTKAMNIKPGAMVFSFSDWTTLAKHQDWAVVHDSDLMNKKSVQGFRNSNEIQKGEPLWVLGIPAGNAKGKISVGTFGSSLGDMFLIDNIDLRGGFSGSPVFDKNGNLVGLASMYNPVQRKGLFVAIESVRSYMPQIALQNKNEVSSFTKEVKGIDLVDYKFFDNKQTQTIIFINGNGESIDSFKDVQALLGTHYNFLRYEQRGQGESTYAGIDFKLDTMVRDLELLVKKLDLKDIHLVGHSFGGRIAIAYAAKFSKNVKSVVVEDMDFISKQSGGEAAVAEWGQKVLSLNKVYPSIEKVVEAIKLVYGNDQTFLSEVLSKSIIENLPDNSVQLLTTAHQVYLWGSYANEVDLGLALQSYRGPLLFLQADPELSAMTPMGIQQILKIRPKAQIVKMVGSGHNIHAQQAFKFVEVINYFLSTVEKSDLNNSK